MPRRLILSFGLLLLLAGCAHRALALPAGWPLPQLQPPLEARALPLRQLKPADKPYYVTDDDSYEPAAQTLQRLLGGLRDASGKLAVEGDSFGPAPVISVDGTVGTGWGIAFVGRGWDAALAQCESALKLPEFEILDYKPGRLRIYHSRDRRMEVTLVAGKGEQLLLCVSSFDPPLPSEREVSLRDDMQRAARKLGESVRTRAAEIAAGK